MILTVDKLEAEVKALQESAQRAEESARAKTREALESCETAEAELLEAVKNKKPEAYIFQAKQRADMARLRYDAALKEAALAWDKVAATGEDGREILRRVEECRSQALADTLAEIWENFLRIEEAADKYRALVLKCNRLLFNIAPIRSQDGQTDPAGLTRPEETGVPLSGLRRAELYIMAHKEAQRRGLPDVKQNERPKRWE